MNTALKVLLVMLLLSKASAFAGNAGHPDDTHYTASGFFDLHVCHWPDRAPFYMALYSTLQFDKVKSIELTNADGVQFAELNLSRLKIISVKGKPEKRVFINQIALPDKRTDGWFSAKITLHDGTVHTATDFVVHGIMPLASGLWPAQQSELAELPGTLHWPAVAGAAHYQVFIKDKWDEGKLIFSSVILNRPELSLPQDLLEHGGYYSWRVHARDVNEDIRLGDFNQGSLSDWQEFTVAD